MNSFANIDYLGHPAVSGHRSNRVRLIPIQGHHFLICQEVDRLAHRIDHRFIQVLIKPHQDPMSFGFGSRPLEFHVFAHDQLERNLSVGTLESGEVDLTVSLSAVRVSRPYESALQKDRNVDGASFLEFVQIHIGSVLPRSKSGDRCHGIFCSTFTRCRVVGIDADRECAGKRLQIDHDSGFKFGLTVLQNQN